MKKVLTVCVAVTDGDGLLRIFGGVSDVKYHVRGVDETNDVVVRTTPGRDRIRYLFLTRSSRIRTPFPLIPTLPYQSYTVL